MNIRTALVPSPLTGAYTAVSLPCEPWLSPVQRKRQPPAFRSQTLSEVADRAHQILSEIPSMVSEIAEELAVSSDTARNALVLLQKQGRADVEGVVSLPSGGRAKLWVRV
jgi:hypothetical protein